MSTPVKGLDCASFRDAYKDYNKSILSLSKTSEWRKANAEKWSHKQLCLQHKLYPNLIEQHFSSQQIPSCLFSICQCGIIKQNIHRNFCPVLRISLDKALEASSNWKTKAAHFADLNININNGEYLHLIQMLKIKIGAVKRYTQPKTNTDLIGTASFFRNSIFWQLGTRYILECKLKTRCSKEKINVITAHTAKDVACWWYQCWGVHGIRQIKNETKQALDCQQFFAIHDNPFVHKTSLHHNLQRVSLTLYKEKANVNEITASINGIPMINPMKIKRTKYGSSASQTHSSQSSQSDANYSSQSSSQAQPRSQTLSPLQPRCNRYNARNHNVASQKEGKEDKDAIILKLKHELKQSQKRERGLKRKISELKLHNKTLANNLRKQNMEFVPLSSEMMSFSPQQDADCGELDEPAAKRKRIQ